MRIKRGVQFIGITATNKIATLRPELYYAIGIAEAVYAELDYKAVVTAGIDGKHKTGSLHYEGMAVDIRTKNVAASSLTVIFGHLQEHLEPLGFDVVKEVDHIHIEFDAKGKETWITEVN